MSTYRTEFRCGERIGRLDGVASRTSIAVSLPPTLDSGTLAFGPQNEPTAPRSDSQFNNVWHL